MITKYKNFDIDKSWGLSSITAGDADFAILVCRRSAEWSIQTAKKLIAKEIQILNLTKEAHPDVDANNVIHTNSCKFLLVLIVKN